MSSSSSSSLCLFLVLALAATPTEQQLAQVSVLNGQQQRQTPVSLLGGQQQQGGGTLAQVSLGGQQQQSLAQINVGSSRQLTGGSIDFDVNPALSDFVGFSYSRASRTPPSPRFIQFLNKVGFMPAYLQERLFCNYCDYFAHSANEVR